MVEEKRKEAQNIILENRKKASISGVEDIDSFDEQEIRASLNQGAMVVRGEKLHIQVLDLNEGKAVISGRVDSLMYVKAKVKGEKGIIARIMK